MTELLTFIGIMVAGFLFTWWASGIDRRQYLRWRAEQPKEPRVYFIK